MKIQLDTDKKTIKLEDNVLLSKLVETLNRLLPNKEWQKFTLETNTTINHWSNPIVIKQYPMQPYWPWYYEGTHYYASNKATAEYKVNNLSSQSRDMLSLKSGVFNVEI